MKAGLERDKAAVLVVIGAMRDGSKEVLALVSRYRESVESWSGVLRDLRARGIGAPRLLVADGNAAIWGPGRVDICGGWEGSGRSFSTPAPGSPTR